MNPEAAHHVERLTFPKTKRIRKSAEFSRIYQGNVFVADGCLVIQALPNELGTTRMGISVSKKFGNAVVRNRWKRLIREAFRLQQHQIPSGMDLVVRPKRGAKPVFTNVRQSMLTLSRRISKKLNRPKGRC